MISAVVKRGYYMISAEIVPTGCLTTREGMIVHMLLLSLSVLLVYGLARAMPSFEAGIRHSIYYLFGDAAQSV